MDFFLKISTGCLAQQMVEEALTLTPANRCPIDVLAVSPLFWSPGDVLSFYTVRPVVDVVVYQSLDGYG